MYWRKRTGDNFSPYDESKKYFARELHFKADEIVLDYEFVGKL